LGLNLTVEFPCVNLRYFLTGEIRPKRYRGQG